MRGNTNANTSGGGGSVGNESALDLLIAQNTAKANLATNLQGKGIEANATTETLNQLVNKVPNILVDNSQSFPDCFTINDTIMPLYWSYTNVCAEIKGYFFFNTATSSSQRNYLSYIKKSDIDGVLVNNSSVSLSALTLTTGNLSSQNIKTDSQLCVTSDYSKIYVWDNTGTNNHIRAFNITWNGNDITDVTADVNVDIAIAIGTNVGNFTYRNNKLLTSSSTGIYLYDLSTSTKTTLKSGSYDGRVSFIYWYKDDEFIIGYLSNSQLTIEIYSLNGTTATYIDTIYSSTVNISFLSRISWKTNILEYETGKFKIFIPLETSNVYAGVKLAIYDTYTQTLTEYTNAKTIGISLTGSYPTQNQYNISILYKQDINRYIVAVGYIFFIFDENFNLINGVNKNINNIKYSSNGGTQYFNTFYWLGDKMISFNGINVISIPYYYGKKTIIKKVNSINEQTKEMYYPADEITVADIEAGYYD